MNWLQISITTTKNNADSVESCLFDIGALTVTLTDAADQAILEPAPNETPIWNTVVITGLFNAMENQNENHHPDNRQVLLENINTSLQGIEFSCDAEILQDKNWTREWMTHFHAMQFGPRLWICPLHIEPPDSEAINLRLDPGLAFGTGTHPTTSLCLRWLDGNINSEQKTLLDFGCGSGILAIAACMLGIQQADAIDIDPQALTATTDNAEVNQVSDKISSYLPDDYNKRHADSQYDIVVANILSGPLTELAATLAGHTKADGNIILSGILRNQADTVGQAYSHFFTMDKPVFDEDWVLLHGIKR